MIYFAPCDAPQVLCIDPETHTSEMLGPELDGDDRHCVDGVLAATGKIYVAPCDTPQVICIDL